MLPMLVSKNNVGKLLKRFTKYTTLILKQQQINKRKNTRNEIVNMIPTNTINHT